jgi:hypothetical protein
VLLGWLASWLVVVLLGLSLAIGLAQLQQPSLLGFLVQRGQTLFDGCLEA